MNRGRRDGNRLERILSLPSLSSGGKWTGLTRFRSPPAEDDERAILEVERRGFVFLGLLYALALGIRLQGLGSPPITTEAMHFYVARHLGFTPGNVVPKLNLAYFFWQRPLFSIGYAPGAILSFSSYRALHISVSSLLPVLVVVLLRELRCTGAIAWGAGLVVAIDKLFVTWGIRVLADTPMAVSFLMGLIALRHGATRAAIGSLLASSWWKEAGIVGAGMVVTAVEWAGLSKEEIDFQSVTGPAGRIVGFAALALAPMAYAVLVIQGRFPGWASPDNFVWHLKGMFFHWALIPLVAGGLAWHRSRFLSWIALGHVAFYLFWWVVLGRGFYVWYHILPATLSILAAAVTLDEAVDRSPSIARGSSVVGGIGLLLFLALVAPSVIPNPIEMTTAERIDDLNSRHDPNEIILRLNESQRESVLLIDVGRGFAYYPFSMASDSVSYRFTERVDDRSSLDGDIKNSTATVISKGRGDTQRVDGSLNMALQEQYSHCSIWENEYYVILDPTKC